MNTIQKPYRTLIGKNNESKFICRIRYLE